MPGCAKGSRSSVSDYHAPSREHTTRTMTSLSRGRMGSSAKVDVYLCERAHADIGTAETEFVLKQQRPRPFDPARDAGAERVAKHCDADHAYRYYSTVAEGRRENVRLRRGSARARCGGEFPRSTTSAKPLSNHRPTTTQATTQNKSLLNRSRVSRAVSKQACPAYYLLTLHTYDKNFCRCFGAPACRVFADHLIDCTWFDKGCR